MSRPLRVIVEADGGARGNPGPAGFGAVVKDAVTGEVLAEVSDAIGVATNNIAEYSGLVAGLSAAADLQATQVEVRMDSKLVVEQMSGRWQIKHPGLRPLAAKAATLVKLFESVSYQWIPRERNSHADRLANQAMDGSDGSREPVAAASERVASAWEPAPAQTGTRIVLVRHGETTMTAAKRYSGRGDVPLTELGERQAAAVARRVRRLKPDAVYSSPLTRCLHTAQAIRKKVEIEPRMIECDFGAWEGMTFGEVRRQYADELAAWLGSTSVAPPGGESFEQVARRVRAALQRIRTLHEGQTVVIVSHVSPIKLILRDALSASDAFLHRLFLDPAGLSILDIYADENVAVRTVNDTAHLASLTGPA